MKQVRERIGVIGYVYGDQQGYQGYGVAFVTLDGSLVWLVSLYLFVVSICCLQRKYVSSSMMKLPVRGSLFCKLASHKTEPTKVRTKVNPAILPP
jgi:hypothetical protein